MLFLGEFKAVKCFDIYNSSEIDEDDFVETLDHPNYTQIAHSDVLTDS